MPSETTGFVQWTLRLEGLCVLLGAVLFYGRLGFGWGLFALLFLAPDLTFLAYLAGPRVGAFVYNVAHSYVGPLLCIVLGWIHPEPHYLRLGLIWMAHIGLDRALGYGLKYPEGFGFTHLGRMGKAASHRSE
jgi:hypothetical protein